MDSISIAKWIVRIMHSCDELQQLENAFVLIQQHKKIFGDQGKYLDLCERYKNYKINLS